MQLAAVSIFGQQTYKVGDLFTAQDGSMGVVYYLFPDGSGGWVVALDDQPGSYKWWDTSGVFIPYDSFLLVNSNSNTQDTAGYLNTFFLRGHSSEAGGAVPFEQGWYLPAVKQLTVLMSQLPLIEPVLQQYGTSMDYDHYWSSTINNGIYAWYVDFGDAQFLSKTNIKAQGLTAKVRPVRTFTYPLVEYDTSLTYQWNTGSTLPYINPLPPQTTTYTVTATNESGCSATTSQTIFVAENMPQEIYDEVCQGEPYEANGFTVSAAETATPGTITRTRTVTADGCSAVVTLYLTVLPSITNEIYEEACQTYLWNGITLYEEGDYEQHFLSSNGCDSTVILHLTLHEPDTTRLADSGCDSYTLNGTAYSYSGTYTQHLTNSSGCDSVVVLDLTINPTQYTNVDTTVYNSMHLGDSVWSVSGSYTVTYTNQYGCDSIVTINLTIVHRDTTYVDSTVCDNVLPLEWNGMPFSEVGTQTETFHPSGLYDSVVVMTLHVNPVEASSFSQTACDFYAWAGETYTQSGTYTRTFTNRYGCDSVVTLTLTVNPSSTAVFDTAVCGSFVWNGEVYPESGVYAQTLENRYGCDSIVTAYVTVNYADTVQLDTLVCPQSLPVTVRGFTFTGAGTQSVTVPNIHGCDSTTTVHVDVSDTSTVIANITACDLYPWYDTVCSESGTYIRVIPNSDGCVQTRHLQLTIYHSDTVYVDSACCQNQLPVIWNGVAFMSEGTQSRTLQNRYHCDSVVVMTLEVNNMSFTPFDTTVCGEFEWNGETFTHSGNYSRTFTNAQGCDSVVFAMVTVLPPASIVIDTTVCSADLPVNWHGCDFEHADTLVFTYTSSLACDSTVTLVLYEAYPDTVEQSVSACDVFEWAGDAYGEGGDITKVFANIHGCDSVVTVHLTVNHAETAEVSATSCDSYVWNGVTYTGSGDYTQTLTNAEGCDSVVTLHLTVRYSETEEVTETSCDSFVWEGETYTESGDYTRTYTTASGCDSTVTLRLTLSHAETVEISETSCEEYVWDGETYSEPGDYTRTYTNVAGCDSVVTLHLTLNHADSSEFAETSCDEYVWDGETYTESGDYTRTYTNLAGCDSVVTLHLTLHHADTTEFAETSCDEYVWDGETYTEPGNHTRTYTAASGCDSVVTLHLTLHHADTTEFAETSCDEYVWDGENYSEPGDYTRMYTAASGCDSVVTLHLTLNHADTTEFAETSCDEYVWEGETYTGSGDYTRTYTNASGCDSVVTLHLTLHHSETAEMTETACEEYVWEGETYSGSGDYTRTFTNASGCDSVVTLHLAIAQNAAVQLDSSVCAGALPLLWNGVTFSGAGTQSVTYQTVSGCDSTVTMTLHVNSTYQLSEGRTVCQDELPYVWNGVTFNAAGTQSIMLQTVNGCDSTVTMTLSVSSTYQQTQSRSVCADELPYLWNGVAFIGPDTQTVTLQTVSGCDSVVTMQLAVLGLDSTELYETACDTFLWGGATYTESGDYTRTLTNMAGCDSVVTLHLTVYPAEVAEFAEAACEEYVWNGETYTESGDYTRTFANTVGCDSTVILHLTVIDTALEIISLTEDFCEGMSAELVAVTDMTDYLWSTGENMPNITVTQPGVYSVTAMQGGCRATARYTVEACDFQLWLPNAFTPSRSDGLNDVFSLPQRVQSMVNDFEISIFNRWGEQVFYSTDKNFRWDGSVEGKTFVNTVYTYIIRYTLSGGKPYRVTGSVTVL